MSEQESGVRVSLADGSVKVGLVVDGYEFPERIVLQPWAALKMGWRLALFAFQAAAHTRREQRRKDAQ